MFRDRKALGQEGERQAAQYLERAGYRILDRNVRSGGVEIDLIVQRGRVLAFVEVKTRLGRRFGSPAEAIDARKQARIVRGAVAWLQSHRPRRAQIRFDVVLVEPNPQGQLKVTHWPAAFDATPGLWSGSYSY